MLSHNPFAHATITNFVLALSLNGFVLLPLFIEAQGGTEVAIGLVMGLYSVVGIVCQPLFGAWIDAVGRRPFMLGGVALTVVAALLAALAPAIPVLALVRALQGLGFSAFFVASFSYVIDLVPPERRGWALGLYGAAGFVASALGPLLSEWVIRTLGFRPLFVVAAVVAAAAGVLVWRLGGPVGGVAPPRGFALRGPVLVESVVGEAFQRHMAITLFFGLGSGTVYVFLPTFAEALGVHTLSLFYTAYAASAIGVRLLGGRLIDTHGRRTVIVPSMFVQAAAPAVLAALGFLVTRRSQTPVLPALLVAGLLSGGAHGFLYPGLAALATDRTPAARRGTAVGVFSAMFLVGQAAGAFAFGWVAHAAGYAAMWTVLTALLALGAAGSLGLEERR